MCKIMWPSFATVTLTVKISSRLYVRNCKVQEKILKFWPNYEKIQHFSEALYPRSLIPDQS